MADQTSDGARVEARSETARVVPTASSSRSTRSEHRHLRSLTLIGLIGAALIAAGSALPWLGVQSGPGVLFFRGTEGERAVTLVASGFVTLLLLSTIIVPGRRARMLATILAVLMVAVLCLATFASNVARVFQAIMSIENFLGVRASVGAGIYAGVAGSLVLVGAMADGLLHLTVGRRRRSKDG